MPARSWRSRLALVLSIASIAFAFFDSSRSRWWGAPAVDAHPRISTNLTWHADIAPLFARHCASCHSERAASDAPAPSPAMSRPAASPQLSMPLDTYGAARPWARAIREEVLERRMPPARGRPGIDAGVDDYPLSPMERDLIVAWIDGGAPEGKRDEARTATFWCRMHPEIRADRAGTCPICAMDLAPFLPDPTRRYGWSIDRTARAASSARLAITINQHGTTGAVQTFERVHEYPLHLFIVREDFQRFQHVHPELQANGSFSIAWRPPGDGRYWFYGDFLPVGSGPQLLQRMMRVGRAPAGAASTPAPGGEGLVAADRGITGRLSLATAMRPAGTVRAGDAHRVVLDLSETKTGTPITDLEPYLGAWGHLFLVHEQHNEALHGHPETVETTPGGPTIAFDVLFPRAGVYYVWTQVQREATIVTLPFRVTVVPRA